MQALSHVDLQYNIPAQAGEPETLTGQSAELCSGSDFNFEKIDADESHVLLELAKGDLTPGCFVHARALSVVMRL